MALTLQVISEDVLVPTVTFDAPRVVLGRGQGCDMRLPDASVSRRHASIRQRGADYVVLDEASANGTFVQGVKLAPGAPQVVRTGDVVRCGSVEVRVRIEATTVTPNPQLLTREIALMLVEGALASESKPSVPYLIVLGGEDDGAEFPLAENNHVYVVGRGPQADFALLDEDVSRRHLEVERRGGDVTVRDLGAKNPVRLGGVALGNGEERRWRPGETLQLSAASALLLQDPLSEALLAIEAAPDEVLPDLPRHPPSLGFEETPDAEAEEPPVPQRASDARPSRRGWTGADFLVILLALAILGASITGIFWLVRS